MAKRNFLNAIKKEHYRRNIIICDRTKVIMEGCDKILISSPEKMVFKGDCILSINGKNMRLLEMGNDNLAAEGKIESVQFEDIKNEK